MMKTQNDAVVAENFRITQGLPQHSRRALACAGMSQKKQPAGLGVDQSAAVHFNAYAMPGEIIRDQEFVRGIFHRPDIVGQQLAIQDYLR